MVVSCALRQKTKKALKDVPSYVKNEVQNTVSQWVGLPREELEKRLFEMVLTPASANPLKDVLSQNAIESISKVCPDFHIKFANEVRSQRQSFGFEEGFMDVKVPYSPAPEYETFSKEFDSSLILKYSIANAIFTYARNLPEEKFERFLYLTSQTEEKYIFGGLREAGFPDELSKLLLPYAGKFNRFLVEFRKFTLSNEKITNDPVTYAPKAMPSEEPKKVTEDATPHEEAEVENTEVTEEVETAEEAAENFDEPKDVESEADSENSEVTEETSEIVKEPKQTEEDNMHISPKITPVVILKNEAIFCEFYECLLKLNELSNKKDLMDNEFTHSDFQALSTAYADLNRALMEIAAFGFNSENVWNKRQAIMALFNSLKEFQ